MSKKYPMIPALSPLVHFTWPLPKLVFLLGERLETVLKKLYSNIWWHLEINLRMQLKDE